MGKEMDLNFQLFETATLFITVLVVAFMMQVCDLLFAPVKLCRQQLLFTLSKAEVLLF